MNRYKTVNRLVIASVMLSGVLATACATYYKVTEPQSGRVYYTQEVNHERGGGASFTDAGSGAQVTIQNSEVKEISKDEFDAGRFAVKPPPAAAPAPAPAAPAPAPAPGGGSSP
jgi:hypothetical protein